MRIGIHVNSPEVGEIAAQCRRAEVNEVMLNVSAVPGYSETGQLRQDALAPMLEALAERGVSVYGMIARPPAREMIMGQEPEALAQYGADLAVIGASGIQQILFYPFDRFKNYLAEYDHRKPPLEIMPGEPGWAKIMDALAQLAAAAEAAGTRLGCHNFALDVMQQVIETINSPSLGITYCTGTYQFGYDPYTVIERFGVERVVLAHARNLVRHGPGRQGHAEVPLDKGDIDMARFLNILKQAGYEGLVAPEHLGQEGDLLEAVAYLKRIQP